MKNRNPLKVTAPVIVPAINTLLLLGAVAFASNAFAAQCQMQTCTIEGTSINDRLIGTPLDDVICGFDGDDVIMGGKGNDLICGGAGDDTIIGGKGDNVLIGGIGDDTIESIGINDIVFGNQGSNKITVKHEEASVVMGSGDEYIIKNGKRLEKENRASSDAATLSRSTDAKTQVGSSVKAAVEVVAAVAAPTFTTKNNQIYAPDGSRFTPRGVNIFPWALGAHNVNGIVDCWGFNMVRLHSWILPNMTNPWKDHLVYVDQPLLFDDSEERFRTYDIAPLIEAYTSKGIVVLVDIHDLLGDYFTGENLSMHLQFVEDLALKYKDNPYVWLDIHNEPGSWEGQHGDFSAWRNEVPVMLDTVRAIAPDMILSVSGTAWGQDSGPSWWGGDVAPEQSALLSNMDVIQSYDNLLVTFHMYDQWKFSYDRVKNFVDKLLYASEAPVFIGEYGSWNGGPTIAASQYLHTLVDQPGYEKVGRSVWTWSAWDKNDLVDSGDGSGYLVDSCESPTNLSPLGDLVWNDNHDD